VSSNPRTEAVVDSVILHYFLLVDRHPLLLALLGAPLYVPRIVYDPEEPPGTPPPAMSEMRRAADFQERHAADRSRPATARAAFSRNAARLRMVAKLHDEGLVEVADMTADELGLFGALTSAHRATEFGLQFPLDAGEAACVAIASERRWIIATDDSDALKALHTISARHPYERIRKLLVRAAGSGHLTEDEANAIHDEMVQLGFWDRQRPFPTRRS
jgi:predicted nucleic acid-binding protein